MIIKSFLYFTSTYYCYVIYKKLNPIYHICVYRFNYVILDILGLINKLINNRNYDKIDIAINVLNILILIFYTIGSIIYLEFIELNFCNLNFYTKRSIKNRAKTDITISLVETNSPGLIEEENNNI